MKVAMIMKIIFAWYYFRFEDEFSVKSFYYRMISVGEVSNCFFLMKVIDPAKLWAFYWTAVFEKAHIVNVCVLCLRGVEDVSHNYTRLPSVLMHSLELLFHLFGIHWVMPGLVKDRSEIWYDAYFFFFRKGVLLGV